MAENNSTVRVRFAPSPTGHLHVGSVRVAIFNWLFARHHGGTYLLRIEDTDKQRSKQEYVDSQLASLKWLDLMPDEEPLLQSTRLQAHQEAAAQLVAQGKAYPCFCGPREGTGPSQYDGTCRDKKFTSEQLQKPHAIRFKLPKQEGELTFVDAIRGPITIGYDQLDDFIIVRGDGNPIYQLVVVLDDMHQSITHVIRGEDHISNTPKQILLYEALGAPVPRFAHLPLILGPSGNRLSKRDASVSVTEYKDAGYLPDALFNYLVRLGWAHGDQEIFTKDEMVQYFDLDAVGKKGAMFDAQKLQWLNGNYIRGKTPQALLDALGDVAGEYDNKLATLYDEKMRSKLMTLYQERAVTLVELAEKMLALAVAPQNHDLSLIKKWRVDSLSAVLQEFSSRVAQNSTLTHDELLAHAKELCAQYEIKLVQLAQPLRLALTGGIVSPGVFDLVVVLGKDESVRRINALCAVLQEN